MPWEFGAVILVHTNKNSGMGGGGVFPRMDYIRTFPPQGVYLSQASGVMNGTDFTRSGI